MPTPPAPDRDVLYALRGVGRRYGGFEALREVSLDIRRGERVGLIGPSGAGKSTLLSLLNTAALPTEGSLQIFGEAPALLSPRALRRVRARIGTVHQLLDLVPQSSAFQNVFAGRLGRRSTWASLRALVSRREAAEVGALFERLGIADKLHARVDRLSGGEQQRVAVARALHQAPEVLLADEPLASVDPARAAEVVSLLLQAAQGRTLVVSTHQLEPVLEHLTRVVGLRGGRVLFDLPARDVTAARLEALYTLGGERPRGPGSAVLPVTESLAAPLRLGVCPLAALAVLPRVLERAPAAPVGGDSAALVDEVRAGRLDAALVDVRVPAPELVWEEVAAEEVLLVASPARAAELGAGDGVPPEVWARSPRVECLPPTSAEREAARLFTTLGAALRDDAAVLRAASSGIRRAAWSAGLGYGFAARAEVAEALAQETLVALPFPRAEGARAVEVKLWAVARRADAGKLEAIVTLARGGAPRSAP